MLRDMIRNEIGRLKFLYQKIENCMQEEDMEVI
jgi:hypothetical protein